MLMWIYAYTTNTSNTQIHVEHFLLLRLLITDLLGNCVSWHNYCHLHGNVLVNGSMLSNGGFRTQLYVYTGNTLKLIYISKKLPRSQLSTPCCRTSIVEHGVLLSNHFLQSVILDKFDVNISTRNIIHFHFCAHNNICIIYVCYSIWRNIIW